MPLLPITHGSFYGLPIDLQWERSEYQHLEVRGLSLEQVRVVLVFDVGLSAGPILQEFIAIFVRRDGRSLGMLLI